MKLTHLGISHFRSIGETPVMIDLDKKITILVGQNDCGKSNVLRGIQCVCELEKREASPWNEIDYHQRNKALPPLTYLQGTVSEQGGEEESRVALDEKFSKGLGFKDWNELLKPDRSSGMRGPSRAKLIASALPRFFIIPQFRRIEAAANYSISGSGIIKLLSLWQHPEIGKDANRQKFDRIEKLLRSVLGRRDISLEVPHTHQEILVRDGSLRLPLESHGTGIHQLIILAIAVLSQDNVIFGIEEPEIHLHPVLQRRFLKFLKEETGNNRYVITTHSPTLIAPAADVDVIHLKMVDGVTIPTPMATDAHTLAIMDDLGIQPSDLLQANSVIWVEGPSDRIYLNHWLKLLAPEMTEGIDYAIMFYGGRLLAHLTMEREPEEEDVRSFIQLLRINQHSAIVIDSDRKSSTTEAINQTKQRVVSECEETGQHAWVTDGKEIENYLPASTVEATLDEKSLLNGPFTLSQIGKFENAMKKAVIDGAPAWTAYEGHKVEWAHRFCKHMREDDLGGDLKGRMNALITFIRRRQPAA